MSYRKAMTPQFNVPTIRRKPFLYPTAEEMEELTKDIPKMESSTRIAERLIYQPARAVAADLQGKNIPAADLTNEQKCALFSLAGFMKYEDGRMVSIRPVGITDNGRGGYILGIRAETI